MTRPVGSINSKNGRQVDVLREGKPVTTQEVMELYERMQNRPFATVFYILTGSDRMSPCPVCGGADAHLSAGDHVGHCYGECGRVSLAQLYDQVFIPLSDREATNGTPTH